MVLDPLNQQQGACSCFSLLARGCKWRDFHERGAPVGVAVCVCGVLLGVGRYGSVWGGRGELFCPSWFRVVRRLRQAYAEGPMVVLGGGRFRLSEVTLYFVMSAPCWLSLTWSVNGCHLTHFLLCSKLPRHVVNTVVPCFWEIPHSKDPTVGLPRVLWWS